MIDSVEKLKIHLRIMKKQLLKQGCEKLQLYPMFCMYYENNKDKYLLSKIQVLDVACEIFIEED